MKNHEVIIKNIPKSGYLNYNSSNLYHTLKRLFDIVTVLFCFILNIPVLILISILKLIFFDKLVFIYNEVFGLRGRKFKIYGFYKKDNENRQLIKCVENGLNSDNPGYETQELKKESLLDEIPQSSYLKKMMLLLNVLKGEMSIVGPMPLSTDEMKIGEKWHVLRLSVKPGITGLWQISGIKGDFREMVWYDLKYIREQSFIYDLRILLKALKKKLLQG